MKVDLLLAMFGPDAVAKLLAMPPGAIDAAYDAQMAIPPWTIRANGTLPSFTDLDGHLHVGQWLSPQELDAYFSGLDAGLKHNTYSQRLKKLARKMIRWATKLG